jgi:hypothetical protein
MKVRPDNTTDEEAIGIKTDPNGSVAWPTDRYLNIWVCNVDVLGYSSRPADYSTYPQDDGIVVKNTAFGRTGSVLAPYHKGRTATHEIGHWLNLEHLWGDQNENVNCTRDDFVGDTPKQKLPTIGGCPNYPDLSRRCDANDPSTMFMNYMDYSDDICMNIYTNGQKLRARALFAVGGPREQQLNNCFKVRQSKTPIRCTGIVYSSPACLSTTWAVLSGPATLTSAPGVNQATLHATGTGTVVIRAASGNYTTDDNIQVTDVPPPLTGTYFITSNYHNPGTQYTLYNNNSPIWLPANKSFEVSVNITSTEHTSPIWTRASNSYPFNWSTAGPFVSFSGTSGSSVNQQRNAIFNFTAQTSCGTFNGTYTWPVVIASWLRIATSPNPASDNLLVSIEEESSKLTTLKSSENISISLYDFNTNMLVKKWTFNKGERKFNLNIASIMRGQYVLIIRRGKEHGSKQVMLQ